MQDGPEFYDDSGKVDAYRARRYRADSPNESLEKPVFLEMLGDVAGKRVLDLGSGDGRFALELLGADAHSYLGVEASPPMVCAAHEALRQTAGEVVQARIEDWSYPADRFDLVISRLALHYVADLDGTFRNVYASLAPGGRLVFSIVHPVITSSDRSRKGGAVRQDWIVDGYFVTGARQVYFMGEYVVQYHRTIEDIYTALLAAGFVVEQLRESRPRPEAFADKTLYERRRRIPLFLFLSAGKP